MRMIEPQTALAGEAGTTHEVSVGDGADDLTLTRHAGERASERRIPLNLIGLIAHHGRRLHAAGAVHCFWGRREAQQFRAMLGAAGERLEGRPPARWPGPR